MSSCHFSNKPHGVRRDGKKLNTRTHAAYILREEDYAHMKNREEDFVYSASGNLPDWANGDALAFWEAAEKNRRANGRAYRELIIGLQNELSVADNRACIEEFLDKTGISKHHAYTYAIHDKEASFGENGERNLHVHVMFCEKKIEPERPLPPEQYFARYTEINGNPIGGYKADRYWHAEQSTHDMRGLWEDIVNAKFKKQGLDVSISLDTLEKQRKEALEQGDIEKASLLDREPSKRLPESISNPAVKARILELVDTIKADTEAPVASDVEPASEQKKKAPVETEADLSLVIFAEDIMIRRLAKEIQKQRLAIRKENQKAIEEEIAKQREEGSVSAETENTTVSYSTREKNAPIIITVGDILNESERRMCEYSKAYSAAIDKINIRHQQIVPKEKMWTSAKDKLTEDRYSNLLKEVKAKRREEMACRHFIKHFKTGQGVPYKEYEKAYYRAKELRTQRVQLAKEYVAMRRIFARNEFQLVRAYNKQVETNQTLKKEITQLRTEAYKAQQKYSEQYDAASRLFGADPKKIIFSEPLPKQVDYDAKLYGKIPVRRLPKLYQKVMYNSHAYHQEFLVVGKNRIDKNQAKAQTVMVVKRYDDTQEGKAPVYKVTVLPTKSKKGKSYTKILSIEKTNKKVPLYEEPRQLSTTKEAFIERVEKGGGTHKPSLPKARPVRDESPASKPKVHIVDTNERSHDNMATGKNQDLWREEDNKRMTEMERVEAEVKRGWSL